MTNATTTAGVGNVSIYAYNTSDGFVCAAGSSVGSPGPAVGTYTLTCPAGSYYLFTYQFSSTGLIDQVYKSTGGVECAGCRPSTSGGTLVTVTAGGTTPSINFPLRPGPRVRGAITNSITAAPLSGIGVNISRLNSSNSFFIPTQATSDANGNYVSNAALPPGSAFSFSAVTGNSQGFIERIHPNTTCVGGSCPSSTGTPITFSTASSPDLVSDFTLTPGAVITGKVTSSAGGAAITSGSVSIFNSTGSFVTSASLGSGPSAGVYTTTGLLPGDYYARASTFGTPSFVTQLYSGIPCTGCTVTTGTKITLAGATAATGIDFVMQPGGSITGKVTDSDNNPVPAGGFPPFVQLYSTTGAFVTSTSVAADGTYTLTGLATGSYIVRAFPPSGSLFISRLYKTPTSVDCFSCDVTVGSGVAVTAGVETPGIDFTLTRGGNFAGKITNKATTVGVSGAFVSIYNAQGSFVGNGFSDSSGNYSSSGLLAGSYFAYASGGAGTLIPQVYSGIPCVSCSITSGTPIEVTLGVTKPAIDFALDPAGTISGKVTDTSNNPIGSGFNTPNVQVYSSDGFFVTSRPTDSAGVYSVGGLQTGKYFVRVSAPFGTGFISRLYVQPTLVDCFNCDVTQGTPISVTAGADTPNINLTMSLGGVISGSVKDAVTSAGIPNASLSVSSASGASAFGGTDSSGNYAIGGLPSGSYFVRISSIGGGGNYVREIYAGPGNHIVCLSCNTSIGTPVPVTVGSTTSGIDFQLSAGGSIGGTVKDAGGASISGSVSITDSLGNFVGSAGTSSGAYSVSGLPAGTYFARTSNSQGFIDRVFDGITCLSCSAAGGTPIPLAAGASRTDVNFTLAQGGKISGKLTDTAGNLLGGITGAFFSANVYSASGSFVASASTNASGVYTTTAGLPTGNYYVLSNNNVGYINGLYSGLGCFNCPVTTGTPVAVTAGSTTTDIDLVLAPGGKITGKVETPKTSGTGFDPVANAFVQVYSGAGSFLTSTSTNALGNYSVLGLPTATYFLRTSNSLGFIDQLFANSPCLGCDVTTGTPVPVTVNSTTANINFTVAAGGTITGSVKDAATGAGLANVSLQAYTSTGSFVRSTTTQSNGTYSLKGLETGSYFLRTFNNLGYINVLRASPDIICGSCSITAGTLVPVTVGSTTSGIDFSLNIGGTLRGRVTTTDTTPVGIQSVSILVFNSTGSSVGFGFTDSSGNYTVGGLLAGDVFVKTSNSQGFIDRVYNGIECLNCSVSAGTPVAIVLGTPTENINFALPAGGRIRGRVTDSAATPNPLQGVTVDVSRSNGSFVTSGFTGVDGRFVSNAGLPAGDYVLRTRNNLGYVDKLYDGITCLGCSVVSGKIVTLSPTASLVTGGGAEAGITTAENIDFALSEGGSISGTVTAANGTPLQGVFVQVYTGETGLFVSSISTNGAGRYILRGLPTGSYVARTSNAIGYIDQLFGGSACVSCQVLLGTRISVTVGSTTTAVDFSLTAGGRVGGTITAASGGAPIGGASVQIYNASGAFVASGFSSPSGSYITGGLPAGTYYARTFNSSGFINQLHASIVCQSCTTSGGTPIVVTLGATTTVNFSLATGGTITGTITDASNQPVANATVSILTPSGLSMTSAATNAAGVYRASGLPTGTYVARTFSNAGLIAEQYDNQPCLSCSASNGAPIAVTAGSTTTGIDFSLAAGGRISGAITDAATGKPLAGVSVQIFNSSNFFVTSVSTDNVGNYVTRTGLPAGSYYARTSNALGYINLTYPSNACLSCSVTVGNPIAVGVGTTSGIDFALTLGGRISGTITDASTGLPVSGISVSISLPSGIFVGSGFTNSIGGYTTQGLPAGTYYARTSNGQGYINRLYDAIDCVRCAVASGKPIVITNGVATTDINFALSPGGRVTGVVTDIVTGAVLPGASVTVFDSAGFSVAGATANALGVYTITTGLTTGTYYARTFNQFGYVNRLYDTFPCLQCNVTTGKPIAVTAGATTTGIDFPLSPGGRISGTVTAGGAPVPQVFADVFSSGGTFITSTRTGTNGQYLTAEGLLPGTYYVVSENYSGLIDQLYNGSPCSVFQVSGGLSGSCAITSGTPVVVAAAATTSGIDFNLVAGGRIRGKVTNKATGDPIFNAQINVYNQANGWVGYGFTDGLGNYDTANGLASGTYYVRASVSNLNNPFVSKVYNDITCPACDATSGTGVVVTVGSTTPNIDFALETGEVISGTVTDAGSNQPIAGALVRISDQAGLFVTSARTNDAGGYTTPVALPAGTYFARTSNGLGYVDRLYDTAVCLACDVTRGTPIVVDGVGATGGINFALTAGGRLAGTVTVSATGATVAGSKIRFFNSTGSFLGETFTNGVGAYTSPGLPPGNYFVRTVNYAGLIDELHNDVKCTPCSLSQGTAVTIVTAGLKSGIDFALDSGGLLSGFVKDQATGSPIAGVTVAIHHSPDGITKGILVATTDPTDSNGFYSISLPATVRPEAYIVEPNPVAGFRPALTGLRGPLARSTVNVDTGTETGGIGFSLVACSPLTVNPSTLPLAAQGQLYSSTFTASGGTGPYTFSISDGTVNTGLALNSAGLLAGAPVFAGTGNFTVAAMDANQCAGTRVFALTACSFFLSTPSLSTTANAGTGTVELMASAVDCPWVVTTADSWITVTSAVNGTGNATVAFSFGFNGTGAARSGTLRIGGQVFTITQSAPTSSAAFGAVDTPADGVTGISGSLAVTGWALDDIEVKRVTISRTAMAGEAAAEIYIGDATLVDGARPDVAAVHPTLPFNTRAGWGYLLLTNMLPNLGNGPFTLHMDAIDAEGSVTRLGSRTFVADNANAVTPFGAIDTPAQGGTVTGTMTNFGWVLSPGAARADPPSGGTVQIVIDGAFHTTVPGGWTSRSDLASLFPASGYTGISNALGVAVFDSTTFANGVHTIAWLVTDNAGRASGIGSRYFTVNNILASQRFAPSLASMRAQATAAPSGPPVALRVGFDRKQPMVELATDSLGGRFVAVGQLGRLELRFGQACGVVKGVQIANGERVSLPIGSTLDGSGSFQWMPGPAFLGSYQLEFSVPSCSGGEATIPVTIAVLPGR